MSHTLTAAPLTRRRDEVRPAGRRPREVDERDRSAGRPDRRAGGTQMVFPFSNTNGTSKRQPDVLLS